MRHRDSTHRLTAWLARVLPPLAALGLAVLAYLPALRVAGIVATRAGGDSPFLLQRVHQMSAALIAGQLPPRWMPDAAYGLGYPFWNYYSPLAYGLPGAIVVLGGGFVGAIKITGLLCFLAAAGGAYRLGRETWDSRAAGFLASAAYTFAPYHLVNVYVRGDALAELAAYAVFPWVLVALDHAVRRRSAGATAGLALVTALLLVSHNISALLFAPVVLAYALWRLWVSPRGLSRRSRPRSAPPGIPAGEAIACPSRRTVLPAAVLRGMASAERRLWPWRPRGRTVGALAVVGGLLLGAGLAAWFVLPAAFLERDAVQLGENTTGYFHYANHFRSLDLVDLRPLFNYAVDDAAGAPTRVGLVQLLLALLGLVAGLVGSRGSPRRGAIGFWAAVALLTTLMITPLSKPLWDFLPLLDFAQFPWRWLSVQALALAMLTGLLVAQNQRALWRWPLALVAAAVLALAGMADLRVETLPVDQVTRNDLTTYEVFTGNIGSTVRSEYLPAAVAERPRSGPGAILGHAGSPRVTGGAGTLEAATLISHQAASQDWQIKLAGGQPATVAFPTLWFPGWTASINGGSPRPTGVIQGSGWLTVDIEQDACGAAGQCFVSLTLARSDARALAEGLSLVAFLLVLALLLVDRRRHWGWILLALVLAVPALALASRSLPVGRSGGPVTLDLARTPYPHANPDGVNYGDARLVAAKIEAQNAMQGIGGAEGQTPHLEAGEKLMVNLNWQNALSDDQPLPPDLRVEASLVSPAEPGFGVPAILASADQAPNAPEALVLEVPPDAATGLYFVRLDVTGDGEPVTATSAEGYDLDTVYLGPVRVRAKPGQITPPPTFVAQMGDVTLHDIRTTRRWTGDQPWLEVRMLWQAARPLAQELMTSVRLIDAAGRTVAQEDKLPLYGNFPTTVWPAGEIVADQRWLPLPEDIEAGEDYRVEVVLYNPATGEELGTGRLDDVSVGP